MQYIYIDESGSMTQKHSDGTSYFIITLVRVNNTKGLKRAYKRFVSSNYSDLKNIDTKDKMFKNEEFFEIKGSAFNPQMKNKFLNFFCRNKLFEVYYIKIDNQKIKNKLYDNTARAFNYVLGLAFKYFLENKMLPYDNYYFTIDERNVKTCSKNVLNEYLNIKLTLESDLAKDIVVKYLDSSNCSLIQIADVFSNIYYSSCYNSKYSNKLDALKELGYIKYEFFFPL